MEEIQTPNQQQSIMDYVLRYDRYYRVTLTSDIFESDKGKTIVAHFDGLNLHAQTGTTGSAAKNFRACDCFIIEGVRVG